MCEVFSTSWGFLVDFKRFLFVQFVGHRATNLEQGDGEKNLSLREFYSSFRRNFLSILPENQLFNVRNSRIIVKSKSLNIMI